MKLQDRVALLTGGRRLGAEIATALATHGVDVSLSYHLSVESAERAAKNVHEAGRQALVTKANVTDSTDVSNLIGRTVEEFGRLDIVVNMASVYRNIAFDELTDDAWRESMRVDLEGAYLCARAAIPHMRSGGGGHIVNFSDWTAASGRPRYKGFLPYYVAKRAVMGLTEALALELAADHIAVNAIAPGPIIPPESLTQSEIEEVERATPLGRWGGGSEIASAVIGLLQTDFVTGETIRVDGGRHLR